LPEGLAAERESKCPWDFADSHIEIVDAMPNLPQGDNGVFFNGFRRRIWDKEPLPEGVIVADVTKYRIENKQNKERGTIDIYDYLVYTEGVRCAQTGTVFPNVKWVKSFPDTGLDEVVFGMDFGFTTDPTTFNRIGRVGKRDAYIENLVYQPTPTPEVCFYAVKPAIETELARRKREGNDSDEVWVCCESQDKYGTETFVDGLNEIASSLGLNWNFFKIEKKSIVSGVVLMKKFNLHLVETPEMIKEQQNYLHRKIHGSQPVAIVKTEPCGQDALHNAS
jgi:hypothetical protein